MAQSSDVAESLIYDWNETTSSVKPNQDFDFDDETLRDGVQSPSITHPSLDSKIELIELMSQLGITSADIGLPGAGKQAFEDTLALARHIQTRKLKIKPNCAARTLLTDIEPVAELMHQTGQAIALYTFIGSSPIRQWVESWDLKFILKKSRDAIRFAVHEGMEVGYVTEDTIRSSPQHLRQLFTHALDEGVSRLVLCDTVGHATPMGTRALVRWTAELIKEHGSNAKIDWHGHNDRGLALSNAMAALQAGAHRIHGCALGVGERIGNTSMDLLLLNLKLMKWIDTDLSQLSSYVTKVSASFGVPIAHNYPLFGKDAFRTATGVHAAAILKARKSEDVWLADRVYSGVPAGEFGKEQEIEVGPLSGMSNVVYWLELRGISATKPLCKAILDKAKESSETLTEAQVIAICEDFKEAWPTRKNPIRKRRSLLYGH